MSGSEVEVCLKVVWLMVLAFIEEECSLVVCLLAMMYVFVNLYVYAGLSYLWLHLNQCHFELLRRSHVYQVFHLKSGWVSSLWVACSGPLLSEQPLRNTLYDHKVMNRVAAIVKS